MYFFKYRLSLLLITSAAIGYFLRAPNNTLSPALYAEDGPIFLTSAAFGGLSSIFSTYAGYHHLFQRLVALITVNAIHPFYYPHIFLAFSWFCYLLPLVCSEFLVATKMVGSSFRVSYLPYVLYPYATETYLNLPNAYIFFPLGFIVLVFGVSYHIQNVLSGRSHNKIAPHFNHFFSISVFIYGFIASLTGPFVFIFLMPLLIYYLYKYRSRLFSYLPWFLSVPVIISSFQIFTSQVSTIYPVNTLDALKLISHQPSLLLRWFAVHISGPFFGGHHASHFFLRAENLSTLYCGTFLTIAILVLSLFKVSGKIKYPSFIFLPAFSISLLLFATLLTHVKRGIPLSAFVGVDHGGRFFIWTTLFSLSLVIGSFYMQLKDSSIRSSLNLFILSLWLPIFISNYSNNMTYRSMSPSYHEQISRICDNSNTTAITLFPGPPWSFRFTDKQLRKACNN